MDRPRVVVTGLGCVTALAEGAENLFQALCKGKSGISYIDSFDTSQFPVKIGGQIKDFDITKYIDAREAKRMDPFTQYAVASADQAIKDSGIDFSDQKTALRTSTIIGSGIGGLDEIEDQHGKLLLKGPKKVSPFCVPKLMANAACGIVSMLNGLQGPNFCVVTACASANHAIGEAYYNIITGRSDISVTGGAEAAVTPVGLASFCALRALSKRNDEPTLASRPFDINRDGFVLSEGAGIIVLEEYEHAKKRGAKIYAEMLGYGATADAYHITAPRPDGSGAARSMQIALDSARLNPEQIDYINAHGTSTSLNDAGESQAIMDVFGDAAYDLCISSTKGCTGHLLGASGGIEAIAMAKAISDGIVPPTNNLDEVDPACNPKLDFVPNKPKEREVKYAISNSLGFGGHNATILMGKL